MKIKFFQYFILVFIAPLFSCTGSNSNLNDDRGYEDRYDDRRVRSDFRDSGSERRRGCSDRSSRGGVSINSNLEDIDSQNAGEYSLSGKCEDSSEDVEISISGKRVNVACSGKAWRVLLDVTSVVQGADVVDISASSSSSSACESVENYFNCPENYIPVPQLSGYTERDFCVMKYEARSEDERDRRYGLGYDGRSNDRRRDEDRENYYDRAVSSPDDEPWTQISYDQAKEKCQNNGAAYSLISNDEWQTIARHIESEDENWSLGRRAVQSGNVLNRGMGFSESRGERAGRSSSSYWEENKRSHILPNGEEIWDFSGGVWEMILDSTSSLRLSKGDNDYISNLSGTHKDLFGPKNNYRSVSERGRSRRDGYAGLGYAYLSDIKEGIARGGSSQRDLGIFSVTANIQYGSSRTTARATGFRCVFHP